MPRLRGTEIIAFENQLLRRLREQPVRLLDIRAMMGELERFIGTNRLEIFTITEVIRMSKLYFLLPDMIALYWRKRHAYLDHVRNGDIDGSSYRPVLITALRGLCDWWLDRHIRYPYGDVRLLRPIIGGVLIEAAEWERNPYPDDTAQLATWYEQLAPGGELYPGDDHLAYVERFESFAEDIVWDNRGQDYITIVNFPAPPNALPPDEHWCTQHIPCD